MITTKPVNDVRVTYCTATRHFPPPPATATRTREQNPFSFHITCAHIRSARGFIQMLALLRCATRLQP
ncbi:hypothetical protein V2G26_008848 [Clonostachys chloroleuca]